MIGGKLPAQRAKAAHFVGHLPAVYAMGQTDHLLTATLPAWPENVNVMLPTCGQGTTYFIWHGSLMQGRSCTRRSWVGS